MSLCEIRATRALRCGRDWWRCNELPGQGPESGFSDPPRFDGDDRPPENSTALSKACPVAW